MSTKAQKVFSPTKENMSPTRVGTKGGDPVTQLLGFIKAAGLKLPSHIEKTLNQEPGSFMKVIAVDKPSSKQAETMQKLKVKLGDTEFELKKLEQDFAQYKLNSRLQKQKEVKRWQEAYNHLKNTLEYSNQDASIKLVKLRQGYEKQIQSLKQKHEAQTKQQKQKITAAYEQKISSQKKLNERQVKQLKQKSANQLSSLKAKHESELKQLKEANEAEIRKLSLKHKQTLDAKEKQYESIYVAIQSEKKTEQKLHEKTRIEASQAKQKLYSELYYQRNLKKDLEETLQKREADIKSLKSQIHDLEIDIILQREKMQKRQLELRQDFEKQKIGMQQLNKQHLASLLESHEKQLKKLQISVHQINEWKQNKEVLMTERYDEIESKFDDRPSRQEDLDMIEKLRSKLQRKEEEVRLLSKQLKICVMESQNKEETYNKIFTSNTMNKFEKKCLTKDRQEFKSKDSLCRKSQTTDIKFLLKVYNKHI